MRMILAVLAVFALSAPAHAAKFESIRKFKNKNLEALAKVALVMTKDEKTFGDATMMYSASIEGNKDNQKTCGQLNHIKGGINSDDTSAVDYNKKKAGDLADTLFSPWNTDETKKMTKLHDEMKDALGDVVKDKNLEIYGASHSDEDGTWEIIDVIDIKNDEVLFLRSGGFGT